MTMDNKEARHIVNEIKHIINNSDGWSADAREAVNMAFDMAIEALRQSDREEQENDK